MKKGKFGLDHIQNAGKRGQETENGKSLAKLIKMQEKGEKKKKMAKPLAKLIDEDCKFVDWIRKTEIDMKNVAGRTNGEKNNGSSNKLES